MLYIVYIWSATYFATVAIASEPGAGSRSRNRGRSHLFFFFLINQVTSTKCRQMAKINQLATTHPLSNNSKDLALYNAEIIQFVFILSRRTLEGLPSTCGRSCFPRALLIPSHHNGGRHITCSKFLRTQWNPSQINTYVKFIFIHGDLAVVLHKYGGWLCMFDNT